MKDIGINLKDIANVFYDDNIEVNSFASEKIRELQKPKEIVINMLNTNPYVIELVHYETRISDGIALTYFEEHKYAALLLLYKNNNLSEETINIYNNNKNIRYELLKYKFYMDTLSEIEKNEFNNLFVELQCSSNYKFTIQKIMDSGLKKSQIYDSDNINITHNILLLALNFKPEVLIFAGKLAIYWDLDRFLHIYLRHVSELKLGKNYNSKDVFQYEYKNIKQLIISVLTEIQESIAFHFEKNPIKRYSKTNKQAYYYNGDFYELHIDLSGRLETFYKKG